MALTIHGNGSWRYMGKLPALTKGKKRRSIAVTIGPVSSISKTMAQYEADSIHSICKSHALGMPFTPKEKEYIASLSDDIHGRLVKYEILQPRNVQATSDITVEQLFTDWKKAHSHLAPNSLINHEQGYKSLIRYLDESGSGKDTKVAEITVAQATAYRRWLDNKGGKNGSKLKPATAGKRITWTKQWFTWLIDSDRFSGRNPFHKADTSSPSDDSRMVYVSHAKRREAREAMPRYDLEAMIELARSQGLRPSDMVMIKKKHVHFGDGTDIDPAMVLIPSIKTGDRKCPMFNSRVVEVYKQLTKGLKANDYLFDRKDFNAVREGRKTMNDINLATEIKKCYERHTGEKMWAKPFVNMRSSCIIELVEIYKYSEYEVSKCVGNSPKVIRKHYMNQLQADHAQEAKAEKAKDEQGQMVDKMVDNHPVSQRTAESRTDTVTMPIEEYERLVKEQNTLRNKRLNVLLDAVENRSVPSQRDLPKSKEVHLTGVPQSASKHGKYRAARFKATPMVDTMVDTSECDLPALLSSLDQGDLLRFAAEYCETGKLPKWVTEMEEV